MFGLMPSAGNRRPPANRTASRKQFSAERSEVTWWMWFFLWSQNLFGHKMLSRSTPFALQVVMVDNHSPAPSLVYRLKLILKAGTDRFWKLCFLWMYLLGGDIIRGSDWSHIQLLLDWRTTCVSFSDRICFVFLSDCLKINLCRRNFLQKQTWWRLRMCIRIVNNQASQTGKVLLSRFRTWRFHHSDRLQTDIFNKQLQEN